MSRDYRKLRVFELADRLVLETYRVPQASPSESDTGSRLKSGGLPSPQRQTSSKVLRGLTDVARRLQFAEEQAATELEKGFAELAASLRAMSRSLRDKVGS
jgi:hypothetical protein